jgi:hypothetical protein
MSVVRRAFETRNPTTALLKEGASTARGVSGAGVIAVLLVQSRSGKLGSVRRDGVAWRACGNSL